MTTLGRAPQKRQGLLSAGCLCRLHLPHPEHFCEYPPVSEIIIDYQHWNPDQRLFLGRRWRCLASDSQTDCEVEGAPLAGLALYPDLSSHRLHQPRGDGQTQTGSPESSRRGAIGLRKRLEDELLFFRRDANAGVTHDEVQLQFIAIPSLHCNAKLHLTVLGKLDCIPYQIHDDLANPG